MDIVGNRTVYKLLREKANQHPDKLFLLFKEKKYTYKEILNKTNQTARLLIRSGVNKGDRVSVFIDNCPEFYFLWYGCAAIGAILVPLNTASTAHELEYFLSHSESKLLIIDEQYLSDKLEQVIHSSPVKQVFVLNHRRLQHKYSDFLSEASKQNVDECTGIEVEPQDVCCIMYTSGTTAKPKGVLITHHNYIFAGETSVRNQWLTPEDRYLIFLPLFHANSQYYTSMASLCVGATIVLLPRFSASTFWNDVQYYKPTVSSFVATVIKILLHRPVSNAERHNSLRQAGYGLFVTKEELERFEKRFNMKLFQWYGMTESITTNIVTPLFDKRRYDQTTNIVALGKPSLGQEVKIIDENDNEVPCGKVGQIIIKSPSLMKGYYKNQTATQETLRDGWLYTGDNGYKNEEGYIWFVDRNKDIIKRAGENISSLEIENVLNDHPFVEDSAVISVPDQMREEAVKAFIKLLPGKYLSVEELREYCKERLSYFKVPQYYEFVDEFPRTSIGKIQKNILKQKELEKAKTSTP